MRAVPPRPRAVPSLALAAALALATALAFAAPSAGEASRGAPAGGSGGLPVDAGLGATDALMWMGAAGPLATVPAGHDRVAPAPSVRTAMRTPSAPAATRPQRARAPRDRVRRWYARRNLDGG